MRLLETTMSKKKLLLGALGVGAALAVTSRLSAKPASARPVRGRASYDAIDAYVEEQMHRLKILAYRSPSSKATRSCTCAALAGPARTVKRQPRRHPSLSAHSRNRSLPWP